MNQFSSLAFAFQVSRNQHFLLFITQKDFEKTIYFSCSFAHTAATLIHMYNLREVKFKFLGNKKGPTKGFLP